MTEANNPAALKAENELLRQELRVAREAADITAELVVKQFEETEKMLQRVLAANASKGDFLARMSHEIRTPMNGIIGMSHLLQKTSLNPRQHSYVEKLLGSARNLLKLINDILDFSKIDAGKLDLEKIPFDLDEVLNGLNNVIGLQADEKGLELLFKIAPEVPGKLVGDALRLGQVLLNLTSNAIKFTEEGEVVISIELEERQRHDTKLRFSVSDSGIGLPPERIEHLFEAFNQADDTTTRKHGGTGLGLAICKELVEMMGGHIWAESDEGKGSEFIFTASFGLNLENGDTNTVTSSQLLGIKALVVDDNASVREVLTSMLTSFKIETDCVDSGTQALSQLRQAVERKAPYDLVLLDWMMPGINGIETARRIKQDRSIAEIPAMLMVTGNNREDIRIEAKDAGLNAFLLKPVYASVMYDTITELLGKASTMKNPAHSSPLDGAKRIEGLKGVKVLLVEDNPINQEVAVEFLNDVGIEVEVAGNGREGVEAALTKPFDLILMDVQMPEMDGLEATQIIRQQIDARTLPIVAMTAHAMKKDQEKSLKAGMNDHLSKPVDPADLYRIILHHIPKQKRNLNSEARFRDSAGKKQTIERCKLNLPPIPGIDYDEALRRTGYKSELVVKLLQDFKTNFAATAAELTHCKTSDNRSGLQEILHTLKGVTGYIGACDLNRTTIHLEESLRAENHKQSDALLKQLCQQLDRLLADLATLPTKPATATEIERETSSETLAHNTTAAITELKYLLPKLSRGEHISSNTIKRLKKLTQSTPIVDTVDKVIALIEDIEYESAATKLTQLLDELQHTQEQGK